MLGKCHICNPSLLPLLSLIILVHLLCSTWTALFPAQHSPTDKLSTITCSRLYYWRSICTQWPSSVLKWAEWAQPWQFCAELSGVDAGSTSLQPYVHSGQCWPQQSVYFTRNTSYSAVTHKVRPVLNAAREIWNGGWVGEGDSNESLNQKFQHVQSTRPSWQGREREKRRHFFFVS